MFAPRLEYKYRVDEATAAAVRDYIATYLDPDPNALEATTVGYTVNNLYLDSDDLRTYLDGVSDTRDRFKLRVRSYTEAAAAPLYCEIKRRVNDETIKTRGAVHREALDSLLAGELPTEHELYSSSEHDLRAVIQFVELVRQIEARPRAQVRYRREAWVSRDSDAVRLTMDRDVLVAPKATSDFLTDQLDAPTRPFGDAVVLEIKLSGKAPFWFIDLEQTAGLRRGSAAKYCDGVLARGEQAFSSRFVTPSGLEALVAIENRRRKLVLPPCTLARRDGVTPVRMIA